MSADPDRDPELVWTEAGEPRSGRYNDVYFSAQDGLAEARAVFLQGCGLPEAWAGRSSFTVAELGFGSGLNIAALLDLWRRTSPPGSRLTLFSVEGYPLSRDEARRALSNWPEIAEASEALLSGWPPATPGFHRIDLPAFHAVLDVAIGDVDAALSEWSGKADAWFLDGFAPAANPAMWSEVVMDRIAALSSPGARAATFTVAGSVRRGLAAAGFTIEKREGHGRKRERLEARLHGAPLAADRAPTVAVIGAGIAGAAVVRALLAAGVTPLLVETAGPGAGASGFPSALVTPRFDLGDGTIAALFAQALRRASDLYRPIPGAVLAEGVLQLASSDRDAARFARVADQPIWAEGEMAIAESADGPGLDMREAFTVAPDVILSAWLEGAESRSGAVARMEPADGGWHLIDADGRGLGHADRVVLCAGAGTSRLVPDLALAPVRGQADWVVGAPVRAVAWGGYVAPTADGWLFGATHDRGDTGTDVRAEDTDRNMSALAVRLPALAATLDPCSLRSRAAIRATTRDRLPVAGRMPSRPGLFVLGGLGSRGFCLAPLLAEHVVALILNRPSPLPASTAERISPSRNALRSLAQPAEEAEA